MIKKSIAIIGGGPSALMLAAKLNEKVYDVTIYEGNSHLARKFLVAGAGGFNLTHSEDLGTFISRYSPAQFLKNSLINFTNNDLRKWLLQIGIGTYVGSSKRIFPAKGIKPIEVLNAFIAVIESKGVNIKTNYLWHGWDNQFNLIFEYRKVIETIKPDIVVFALGGASWSKTGSTGRWTDLLKNKGVKIVPFQASNCAYKVNWNKQFLALAEGKALKNIAIKCGKENKKGEVVITQFGIEGGAIYALSNEIRKSLNEKNEALIYIDLKPIIELIYIENILQNRGNKSTTAILKEQLNLTNIEIALLKSITSKEVFSNHTLLANVIKNLPILVTGIESIDKAISTVGGISLNEVDEHFQFKKLANHYTIGEMLNWDAPTGGYLLQACFSMATYLANKLNQS